MLHSHKKGRVMIIIKKYPDRFISTIKKYINNYNRGVPSAVGFPHCAESGERLSLSPKPYPHKYAEAGARTRDLPVTDGRLYRCTRPALPTGT